MKATLGWLPAAAVAGTLSWAGGATAAAPAWNVADTGQPYRDISFDVSEGSWMSLDVSPDGRTIVFDLLGDIYRMPAAGGEATLVQGGPAMQRAPVFSPDGRRLLFLSDASGADNLWISDPDGSNPRQVTHETVDMLMGPAWGADGTTVSASRIAANFPRMHASEIRLFDASGAPAGGGRVLVETPKNGRDVQEAEFSRDGRYVYYTERLNDAEIYLDANHINFAVKRRDLQKGQVESLVDGFGGAIAPAISPDGKHLAFVRRVKAKSVLFVYDIATREQRPVYDALDRDQQADFVPQGDYYPRYAWFPDNRSIAVWAGGKLRRIDTATNAVADIPFHLTARHRITDPVRVETNLEPDQFTVRAVRQLAASPDGRTALFEALGHLWRKSLPDGAPARLTKGEAFDFDAAWSPDGRRVAYVQWDDEKGSTLVVSNSDGRGGKVLASSRGVIRQPSFDRSGKQLVYRIQSPDKSMGGYRGKAGVYLVAAAGGESRYLAAGDDAPQFSPDGRRVYFVAVDYAGDAVIHRLVSVDLDGNDRREHARTPDADTLELRVSPDLRWIAFRDRQQYYVTPYRETGSPVTISAASDAGPVAKLTDTGGYGLAWAQDSSRLTWTMGPSIYEARPEQQLAADAALPRPFAEIGLEAKADVPQGIVAFVGARVIPMTGDEVIERGTVVVQGNRILAVGPADQVQAPPGAKVIDAAGKTIMPGLIDAHGHTDCCYGTGALPQKQPTRYAQLAFGITTNFDPYSSDITSYESTETTLAGITAGPRWIGSGQVIYGRAAKPDFTYTPIDSLEDARRVMAHKRAVGGIVIKSYKQPARAQRQELVKAGREAGVMIDVEGESHFYNNITMITDGHTNLEHNLPLANYYDDIVQFMAKAKAHNTPTLVVTFGELFGENYMYQTTRAWDDPKVKAYVQETNSWYSPLRAPGSAPPYVRGMTTIQAADEIWDIGFRSVARSVKKLDDAGVVINAGSHGQVPGLSQHWEMWLLSQGGMSNMHVLRAATLNPARTLGLDRQVGSLEPGKLADLIVLDKNPLDDIHNTNTVRFTMVNGRLYDSLTLNEIGNYDRPRTRFYWELQDTHGIDWNESWAGQ